jgi:prepilin-type N-terminal cleavage/methylation domain-containing protein
MIKIDMNDKNEKNYGFTLMEILVVMGIMVVLSTLGLLVGLDFYKSYAFNSERDLVVSMLQKARNQSLANINQKEHGFRVVGNNYEIYEVGGGDVQTFQKHPGINSADVDVRFEQLSGDSYIFSGNIVLDDGKRAATISVNSEGRINW